MSGNKSIETQIQDLREVVAVLKTKVDLLWLGFTTLGGAVIVFVVQQIPKILRG